MFNVCFWVTDTDGEMYEMDGGEFFTEEEAEAHGASRVGDTVTDVGFIGVIYNHTVWDEND